MQMSGRGQGEVGCIPPASQGENSPCWCRAHWMRTGMRKGTGRHTSPWGQVLYVVWVLHHLLGYGPCPGGRSFLLPGQSGSCSWPEPPSLLGEKAPTSPQPLCLHPSTPLLQPPLPCSSPAPAASLPQLQHQAQMGTVPVVPSSLGRPQQCPDPFGTILSWGSLRHHAPSLLPVHGPTLVLALAEGVP